jgi:hypothetical protein
MKVVHDDPMFWSTLDDNVSWPWAERRTAGGNARVKTHSRLLDVGHADGIEL